MLKTLLAVVLLLPAAQAGPGAVSGTVTLEGPVPAPRLNKAMEGDPACCALHPQLPPKDNLVLDPSGGVRWAFVYVKKGLEGKTFHPPAQPVQIDQEGCRYTPHVAGAMTGQVVNFRSSDPMMHNVFGLGFQNKGFNFAILKGGVTPVTFKQPEVMFKVACSVHPWMSARIGILDHPYFAVTDAAGKFEIKDLPPGTYTLSVWHEDLGEKEQEIVVKGPIVADFKFPRK